MASGFYLGGAADGLKAGENTAIQQQAENRNQQTQQFAEADKQITATINHIGEIFKAQAAAGQTPDPNNKAVTALIDSISPLAQKIGRDPRQISLLVGTMAQRPAAEDDKKHSVVQIGEKSDGLTVTKQYGLLETKGGTITPIGADGKPLVPAGVPAQPQLSQSEVITPSQAQRANPVAVPSPVASAPDGTPAQTVAARFPNPAPSAATPAQEAPTGPTLPPDMPPGGQAIDYALKNNVVGPEFIKAIPTQYRNTVTGLLDYKVDPSALSKRLDKASGQSEYTRYLSWAHQASGGEYDPKWYKPMQAAIKEFTSGGQTSPAGQITVGNTAIAHGGQVADAIDKLKAVPGLMQKLEASNTPWVSYAAAALKNQSIRGTSEGAALSAFLTASHHFVDETTKFYAGGQPAEAGRARGLENFNGAKSESELYQALNSEAELLSGKVDALQDRWKNAVAGPKGLGNILIRNAIPDFPVLSEKSKASLDRIGTGYIALKFKNGQTSGGNVPIGGAVPPPPPGFVVGQ